MKTKARKWMNVLLGAILGALGYSCNIQAMYGVPSGDLTFDGKVTDESSEPLSGMQVVRRGGWKDGAGTIYWEERADTLYTDENGSIHKEYLGYLPMSYHKVIVNDKTGEYRSDSVVKEVTYSGNQNDAWYSGKATLETNFVLHKNNK